jgi:formylglycine-generating enzyme required for sulfatase activity
MVMFSHLIVSASCLIAVLTANSAWAEPPKPKDAPQGMKFVPLPKGTFYMGWNGKEGSAKKTEIKEDFEIAVYTVTQGQWQAVMVKNPSWFSRDGEGKDKVKDIKDEDLKDFPVETVSWDDCQEFIKKLNEQEKGKGWVYRLPSEEEWEYACRSGATSEEECSYHFYFAKPTNDLSSKEANFNGNFPFGKAKKGPFLERTTKVGSYASNKLGLYDMHGNVWQWTSTAEGASPRVNRGSGWDLHGSLCLAAFQISHSPSYRRYCLGFRLARVPSAPAGK